MKAITKLVLGVVVTLAAGLAIAQMGGMGPGMMGGGMGGMGGGPRMQGAGGSMVRHQYVRLHGVPAPYTSAHSTRSGPADIATGKTLYQQSCAACHGDGGAGDGPAAAALYPPPADLTRLSRMPIANDAYLDWTLSEGGAPIGSSMPAFKETLSQQQIWEIVAYLRTL